MMIKFLARGTGSAAAAADYLTREQNLSPNRSRTKIRTGPGEEPGRSQSAAGNPHQVADVADALQFEHKYTSASSPGHRRTSRAMRKSAGVVDEFEKTAWAGLEPERYAGQRSSTAKRAGVSTCMSWQRAAILRPARA